jgi:hypothetical protein
MKERRGVMKPRWLLLAVGVVCLLVLAPAAALSQEGTEIACGSAVIDGTVGTAEWADATRLPMSGYYYTDGNFEGIPQAHGADLTGGLQPSNGEQTHGWLYLKNDERYLYVGATMDIGEENPDWWGTYLEVAFTDEACGDPAAWLDDEWEEATCEDEPGEGRFWAEEGEDYGHWTKGPIFGPESEDTYCEPDEEVGQGVIAEAGQHTAHYEMRIDLTSSELNCAGPGDCFRFYVWQEEWFCPAGEPDCEVWTDGWVEWPAFASAGEWETPDVFGTICLNPCEVQEEFVPEPGTMLLLGSGLASLAGYAGLRRRERS